MKPRSARSPGASTSSGCSPREAPELSQTEMSAALGLPLPTVHRLTAVLAERGFLERDPRTRRFRLGLEVARLLPPLLSGLRLPERRARARRPARGRHGRDGQPRGAAGRRDRLPAERVRRPAAERAHAGRHAPARALHRARQVPARPAARRGGARRRSGPSPYERRTRRDAHDLGGAATPRSSGSGATGVAQSWEEYEIGLASVAVPVGWLDGPSSAALNVSLPTSRATRAFRRELRRAAARRSPRGSRRASRPHGH